MFGGKKNGNRANWILEDHRFLERSACLRLLRVAEQEKNDACRTGRTVPVKDWFVIVVATETGLRVQEMADLTCGDLFLSPGRSSVRVRNGKGGKKRIVRVAERFREMANEYLTWKVEQGESIGDDAPLFSVKGRFMTKRALQKSFKRSVKRAGIVQRRGVGIHSARHTYGTFLLKASKNNLRLVQEQLGHGSITTTEVYTHVLNSDRDRALARLYGR